MDPRDREVLSLRNFEEPSNGEAVRVLDVGEAAAAKRYVRDLKRLKDVLNAP
jgi:RNA polymerase sigma-70 factor (ECF subfamily)